MWAAPNAAQIADTRAELDRDTRLCQLDTHGKAVDKSHSLGASYAHNATDAVVALEDMLGDERKEPLRAQVPDLYERPKCRFFEHLKLEGLAVLVQG